MRLLLDTCCWLWWLSDTNKPIEQQLNAIANRRDRLFLSVATIWELGIKVNSKKLTLPQPLDKLIQQQCPSDGMKVLDIKPIHAVKAEDLLLHHQDPFDRMIIAQANIEKLTVITSDSVFQQYNVAILL